jgi:hypothetical protein
MAHTNVYMNWTGITVTPASGSAIPLKEIIDVQVTDSEGLEPWQADGHKFPTLLIAATGSRGMTLIGGDIWKLAGIPRNTPCTVVAILNDAYNGVGSGAITHTLSNAVMADTSRSGPTNKFAGGSVTFMAYSPDGTTDPLVIAQAN